MGVYAGAVAGDAQFTNFTAVSVKGVFDTGMQPQNSAYIGGIAGQLYSSTIDGTAYIVYTENCYADIEVTIIATGFAVESIAQNYTPFASPLQARLDAARQAAETEAGSEEETAPEPETKPEEETPAAPARPRWTPPQERQTPPRPTFNRPLSPRPLSDPRTAAPTPSPVIPPAPNTQSAPSPLGRPAAAPQVIESKDKNQPSAFDIDEMENVPAFVRRKMRFVKDNPEEGGRSSRVVLKDDAPQDDKPQGGNSLFD